MLTSHLPGPAYLPNEPSSYAHQFDSQQARLFEQSQAGSNFS
jgi:hypothetical protein